MSHVPVPLDLSPLADSAELQVLYLQADTVVDLAPLGNVRTLVTLNLRSAKVQVPAGIAKVTSLEDLDAPGVFSDAAPLSTLTRLKKLRLGNAPLQHFWALSTLLELEVLDISNSGVADLAPVATMQKLRWLSAANDQLGDLAPLQDLPALDYVVLVGNQVTDAAPLVKNSNLAQGDFVYLDHNQLDCQAQQQNLSALKMRGVGVSSDCL